MTGGGESSASRVDGEAAGASRSGQPRVERCQRRGPRRRGERQVESVGGAQRSRPRRQKEVLRSAVHVAGQLDAVVDALIEAPEDRVLKSSRGFPRERPLVQTTRDCRDDLGYGQIGHEDIIPALHDFVELVTARFGQVELQQGAGVAVEGAGQLRTVCGPSLTEPCPSAPLRADPRGPWRRWRTGED